MVSLLCPCLWDSPRDSLVADEDVKKSSEPQTKEKADTSRGQKRQNPCPSSLRASDMFVRVQQLLSVHDNKLRSGTLLTFSGLY